MKQFKTLIIFCLFTLTWQIGFTQSVKWDKTYASGKLHFLVANDLGRNGYYDQLQIAELMGNIATGIRPRAVLSPGDVHHFEGVRSINDPLWMTNFELIYKHPDLMIEWYPVCGNHEYRGNTDAVVSYSTISRRWEMPSKYYSKTFSRKGVSVKVVFIDTTPLIDINRDDTEGYHDAALQDIQTQLDWLEETLSESTNADWTIVIGHHPIYADSPKRPSEQTDMQLRVNPILRKYNIDMYICGHIHNFQHIRKQGCDIDYILNSSASQARAEVKPIDGTVYCKGVTGFGILTADKKNISFYMIDKDGNIINTITKLKE